MNPATVSTTFADLPIILRILLSFKCPIVNKKAIPMRRNPKMQRNSYIDPSEIAI